MKKIIVLIFLCFLLCSCSKTKADNQIISEIKTLDKIEIKEALDRVENITLDNDDDKEFVNNLGVLNNCSGIYFQKSESTGNVYKANYNFYLKNGEIYASVDFDGYIGTIDDGVVSFVDNDGFKIKIDAKGHLSTKEHDFQMLISPEKARVTWASSEFNLTRGSGNQEEIINVEKPFDETEVYSLIKDKLDSLFKAKGHEYIIEYDDYSRELTIIVELGKDLSNNLHLYYPQLSEEWEKVESSSKDLCNAFYISAKLSGVNAVNYMLVGELKLDKDYKEDNMLLWLRNDTVKFSISDYVPEKSESSNEISTNNSNISNNTSNNYTNTHQDTSSSNNYSSLTGPATFGETNALKTAKDYLSFSAFSWSGLVEQLEFEGYTTSESEYAANNCGADWDYQAYRMAKEYLNFSSFSKKELIEQLEFEGFTSSQAKYGVDKAYK